MVWGTAGLRDPEGSRLPSIRELQLNGINAELFAYQPADQLIESFASCREDKRRTCPVQLEARRLRGDPDLPGRSLRADHDLTRIGGFGFDRQHIVLEKTFRVVFFSDNA